MKEGERPASCPECGYFQGYHGENCSKKPKKVEVEEVRSRPLQRTQLYDRKSFVPSRY